MIFERPNIKINTNLNEIYHLDLYNLVFINCSSCVVKNVKLLKYGFYSENLLGMSYLSDVLVELTTIPLCCFHGIYLSYTKDVQANHPSECMVVMNKISMSSSNSSIKYGTAKYGTGILIEVSVKFTYYNSMRFTISNSHFHHIIQRGVIEVYNDACINVAIRIKNCTFMDNKYFDTQLMIKLRVQDINVTLIMLNCIFFDNYHLLLLSVEMYKNYQCQNPFCGFFSSRIKITNCSFLNNDWGLVKLHSTYYNSCAKVYFTGPIYIFRCNSEITSKITYNLYIRLLRVHIRGSINISNNTADYIMFASESRILFSGPITVSKNSNLHNTESFLMSFEYSIILLNGPITISQNLGSIIKIKACSIEFNGQITFSMNRDCLFIMHLEYIIKILFNGKIMFHSNLCIQIIALKRIGRGFAYIKVMEYSNIYHIHSKQVY